jgi:hypothetical protein
MIHQRIKDRQAWFKELWEQVKKDFPDEEIARIVYRRLVFEEK